MCADTYWLALVWGRTIHSKIEKHINSTWNKEELPEQWKESIIVPNYNMGVKTDCSNHQCLPLLSTTHTVLSDILLSRLTPYTTKIISGHWCWFWLTRSTTDHTFFFCHILEKWESNEVVHWPFMDFMKSYNLIRLGGVV